MGLSAFQRLGAQVPQESRQPFYFTSVRWKNSHFELWERHLKRLEKSFLSLGPSPKEVQSVLERLNDWKASFSHPEDLGVRIECVVGEDLSADFRPQTRDLNFKAWPNRVKLSFLPVERPLYPGGELKVWAYDKIFQDLEKVQAQGFHDVVYVKKDGQLLDASTSNICLIRDGVLYAARPGPGILHGLYLERFLEVARDLGYTVKRQDLYSSDVESADALMLTNCLKGVRLAEGIEKSYDDSLVWKERIEEIERLMHE